jgi:CubicO group peptidase (beta-lactamase class C family)
VTSLAPASAASSMDDVLARVPDILHDTMTATGIPGAAVAVVSGDRTAVWAAGVTNVDHPLSVDADTMFQIGSTTKTFTATAALHLVERGLLDLDTPLLGYIPDLQLADPDVTQGVTLRHVLTHTGGWVGDHFVDYGRGDDALPRIVASMRDLPQLTPLGQVWSYNNAGFYLAALAIQRVAGAPYEDVVRDAVLRPLGMGASFFADELVARRVAAGHWVQDTEPVVATPWGMPRAINGAGGLVCSLHDMTRYVRFHLGLLDADVPLLSHQMRRHMQEPQAPAGSWADEIGLPWLIRHLPGATALSHGGQTNGQVSACVLLPDRDFALVCLTNADCGGALERALLVHLLDGLFGTDLAAAVQPPAAAAGPLTAAGLPGLYRTAAFDVRVRLQGDELLLQLDYNDFPMFRRSPLPEAALRLTGDDRAIITSGPMAGERAEYGVAENGTALWIRVAGRVATRVNT